MEVFDSIVKLRSFLKRQRVSSLGFVPTMGALHAGHQALVRASQNSCQRTVLSIFVNPIQFGPLEDYERYPRDLERDLDLCRSWGVDIVFLPSVEQMYPRGYKTYVVVKELEGYLCGRSRPGHFTGVATVVLKLLHIVQPTHLFLGKKDYQQYILLKKMVEDLNLETEVVGVETVREPDGLAISSRNRYLSIEAREKAPLLYACLKQVKQSVERGGRGKKRRFLEPVRKRLRQEGFEIDYLDIADSHTLVSLDESEEVDLRHRSLHLLAAVYLEGARLIDNISLS